MRHPTQLLLVTALAIPVFAQDEIAVAPLQDPVLVMKTAEARMVFGFVTEFGHNVELPNRPEGGHYVVSITPDRVTKVGTGAGSVGYLQLSVDPGGLMELFADEIGKVKGMVQGIGVMAMTQQGFSGKEATKMLRAVFDAPYLFENATITVVTDPEEFQTTGLDIEVSITAKADNAVGKTFALLKPSSAGVPVLPQAADKAMDIRFSIDPAALAAAADPFLELGLSFSYSNAETRKAAKEIWDQMIKMYDGGFAMSISNKMQMEALYGFLDAEDLAGLMASEDYLEMMRSQRPSRDIEIEVEENAFEHRGVNFTKMTMYNDGMPNPLMPDGEMLSYFAGIDRYMLLGGTEERAKRLADAISDQKIARKPLADGAIVAMDMNLKAWFEAMAKSMPIGDAAEEMPGKMSIRVIPDGRTLRVAIRAK